MAALDDEVLALKDRWLKLTKDLETELRLKWWDLISTKYNEPVRKYHNLHHLFKMFQHLDTYISEINSPDAMSYAIFFHDMEYDVQSQTNEEDSVALFKKFCTESDLEKNADLKTIVEDLILLSKSHCTEEHTLDGAYGKQDRHFFLDFDISILGSDPEEYKEYSSAICEEYQYLSKMKYNFLRTKVLKLFLQIPNIFATKSFREKYEQQARTNIEEEIAELNKGFEDV